MMNEAISTIMTKNPVTLSSNHTLADVKHLFMEKRLHHIPVVDHGVLVGLVTTYDLWKKDIPFDQYASIKVTEIMTTAMAKISPNDKIGTAAELFLDRRFHALPVVQDNLLVGIVTSFDVLRYEFKKEYQRPILYAEVLDPNYRATA